MLVVGFSRPFDKGYIVGSGGLLSPLHYVATA